MTTKEKSKLKGRAGDFDEVIGENLRKYRILKGLTQEDLAEELGVTFQQLQKYERGANRLAVERLSRASLALKTDIRNLLSGVDFFSTLDKPANASGVAEAKQASYGRETVQVDPFSDKDAITLIRYFSKIKDDAARKQLVDMAKTLASAYDNSTS